MFTTVDKIPTNAAKRTALKSKIYLISNNCNYQIGVHHVKCQSMLLSIVSTLYMTNNTKYWVAKTTQQNVNKISNKYQQRIKQARKPQNYASRNYHPLTDSLTGVRFRATSVAKNYQQDIGCCSSVQSSGHAQSHQKSFHYKAKSSTETKIQINKEGISTNKYREMIGCHRVTSNRGTRVGWWGATLASGLTDDGGRSLTLN